MASNTTMDPVLSLGEDFEYTGYCDVWTYYPHGELFAVSLPYNSICTSTPSNSTSEATFMLEGTMYFGLVFLLIVMIRSTKKHRIDWYRLIAFYLVGTLGVPLSNEFGADASGFNRFIGFGVLVHNMAEAAILAVIWRGTRNKSSRGVRLLILYFWLMILLITFLDLHILLWVSSFQGACLDFVLVTSFCTVAVAFKKNGRFFWIAFAASLLHILTIQPLFLGMMLGWTALSIPTVIFLTPTFMIYIWFASSDPRAELTLAQQNQGTLRKDSVAAIAMEVMQATTAAIDMGNYDSGRSDEMMGSGTGTHTSGVGIDIGTIDHNDDDDDINLAALSSSRSNPKSNQTAPMKRNISNDGSQGSNNSQSDRDRQNDERVRARSASAAVAFVAAITAHSRGGDGGGGSDEDMDEHFESEADAIELIIQKGLLNTKHFKNAKYAFKRAMFFGIFGALLDEIFLVFSPCFIDTSFLCD